MFTIPSAPNTPRRHRPGLPLLASATVLALAGCSLPGLPGATGAPDRMPAVLAVQAEPDAGDANAGPTGPAATDPAATDPAPSNPAQSDPTRPDPTPSIPGTSHPAPSSTGNAAPATTAPAEPVWVPVPGDLAGGSTTHRLGAAGHTLIIDYWTTDNPAAWTPDSAPIINFNARIDGPGSGLAIVVTRCNVRVDALASVLTNDTGSFAIEPPYAYSSAMVVPGNPGAASTKVIVTIDLLTETAPGSGIFTRQSVIDSLTIGYPLPGSAAGAGSAGA